MNTQPYVIERVYNASVAKVWRALTDADQMKQWYFDLPGFKAEVGFAFEFTGGDEQKRLYLHKCVVTQVVPLQKLAYTWRYDGFEGNSEVTFELFDEDGKTRLRLTHAGLETFPVSNPDFAQGNFAAGWEYITGTGLKNFIEQQ